MNEHLLKVLARPDVWQASGRHAANETKNTLPTGQTLLDRALHQGGWPRAALTEILTDQWGIGEMQLLGPTLRHCSRDRRRVFLVRPPYVPYAPALQADGIETGRLLIISTARTSDTLWAMAQILRSQSCGCLLAWLPEPRLPYAELRRLQLAARTNPIPVFLFRPLRAGAELSPAALRVALRAQRGKLALEILKQRGGWSGQRVLIDRSGSLLQSRVDPAMLPVTTRRPKLSGSPAVPRWRPTGTPRQDARMH